MYTYDTVSEAVNGLHQRGYTFDFDARFDCVVCKDHKLQPDEFEITEVYRFEGNTDPADEAIVYAIESTKYGIKGILVNGYGANSDELSNDMVKKLSIRH
jgi:hypothetical protein